MTGPALSKNVSADWVARLKRKDVSLWDGAQTDESVADRLGWLDALPWMTDHVPDIREWADNVVQNNSFETVLLLGMGGSSLAAEVFYTIFESAPGYPELKVLDSTCPDQILALDIDLDKTLVMVSSKSGGTVETADLMAYFFHRFEKNVSDYASHFVAITDPGSALEQYADEQGFRAIFLNPPDIGGRYSALSYFGLVPAALLGIDLDLILARIRLFEENSEQNPDIITDLAGLMSRLGRDGINQLILRLAPEISMLSIWIEQLVAESTGKNGFGVLPVLEEFSRSAESRILIEMQINGKPGNCDRTESELPDLKINLQDRYDIGAEFLRWQMATALAASRIGINPFDQPDVEEAKVSARARISHPQPIQSTAASELDEFDILVSDAIAWSKDGGQNFGDQFLEILAGHSRYLAVLAYLPMDSAINDQLNAFCLTAAEKTNCSVTLGYGPRYLHSTGQLHKGGPAIGGFIQIIQSNLTSLSIPGKSYGFDTLNQAQSDGDYTVLVEKNLPVMRICLKNDRLRALDKLLEISRY